LGAGVAAGDRNAEDRLLVPAAVDFAQPMLPVVW